MAACERGGGGLTSSVGVRSSKDRRSGPTRLPSASRITVAPGHCVRSRQSGDQSALRSSEFGFLPVSVERQAVLKAAICFGLCASEEKEIGVNFPLWQQARIG